MTMPLALDDELIEGRYSELGGCTVAFERFRRTSIRRSSSWGCRRTGCSFPHWSVVTSGRVTFRQPDREETYGEGDACVAPPGHLPLIAARTGVVEFSPTADLPVVRQVIGAIMAGGPA